MTKQTLFCIILYFLSFESTIAYKPVVLIHGILTGNNSMALIADRIREAHPGTIIYNTNKYSGWSSLDPMWKQVQELGNDLMNISQQHPDGIHLLGYSQGALLTRVILETFPNHNVHNFISLSGPQAGQYGTNFLHLIFPGLVCETAYELFYSRIGQHTSVGNYWNDPYEQKLFYKYSVFLPFVNNDVESNRSGNFTSGILKLKKMVLIGGPDDGVISPWQSSHFGYYDNNGTVIDLKERDIYKNDRIGLKKLDAEKRLHIFEIPGIDHYQWHTNLTVTDDYIIPFLD